MQGHEKQEERHENRMRYTTKNESSLKCDRVHAKGWPNLIFVVEHITQDAKVYAPLNTLGIIFLS